MTITLDRPSSHGVRIYTEGIAVVMPAYCEEQNLSATVHDFLDTLQAAGIPHVVVVTNDGSSDATGEVLDQLAQAEPDRVLAVHHAVNQGYGAAVRSGIAAALAQTDLRWILLTDSDGQFHADEAVSFLRVLRRERADAVIGYRRQRADSTMRKVNAWLWTRISRTLLGVRTRDVDCAFKLIDRRLLDGVTLAGEAAAISPELLAKIGTNSSRIVQHPVGHYPRQHGEETGARLSVIARSLLSLATVWLELARDWLGRSWLRRLFWPADPALAGVTLAATALSIAGYLYFLNDGAVLAYPDATSHLLIARRVLESPTAGLAQLGGVWLPLPHLLALPLVWSDWFYQTGLAGAIVSMVAFVITVRYLYLLGTALARSRFGGLATALVFAVNANALYMQSTAMTELLLFACVMATVYHLHRWCSQGHYRDLVATSAAVLFATLTRYEGWILCLAVLAVILYSELRQHRRYVRVEAALIFYGFIAMSGIVGWLVWNQLIFDNPLYWQDGEYADSTLWVGAGDVAVGDVGVAAHTYWLAMTHNIGLLTIVLAALGIVAFLVRTRLRPDSVAVYPLLVIGVFFVYALYSGQRPLHVEEINGDLYNVRFGLIMLLPAAVFAGYLVSLAPALVGRLYDRGLRWPALSWSDHLRVAKGVTAGGILLTAMAVPGVVTLDEARDFRGSDREAANAAASAWLRDNHDNGLTLMMSYENESVTFDSHVDTAVIVYEGSYRLWEAALADPAGQHIEWIYMRALPGQEDEVWQALYGTPQLADSYDLVYEHSDRLIYQRKAPR